MINNKLQITCWLTLFSQQDQQLTVVQEQVAQFASQLDQHMCINQFKYIPLLQDRQQFVKTQHVAQLESQKFQHEFVSIFKYFPPLQVKQCVVVVQQVAQFKSQVVEQILFDKFKQYPVLQVRQFKQFESQVDQHQLFDKFKYCPLVHDKQQIVDHMLVDTILQSDLDNFQHSKINNLQLSKSKLHNLRHNLFNKHLLKDLNIFH
ncbi:unnamed protein product [Paramecium sonneborni]|uniref:Uncharacterized protein n=1 Tax=Paramecium sonneborni TaxID=65129 RepID=A0A8S1MKB1_9CILI|nr:unnamed protein product [Paramecium sonneborni]